MFSEPKAPVDTIELLLREIAERLRKKADEATRPRASLALVALACALACACGPQTSTDKYPLESNRAGTTDDAPAIVHSCVNDADCGAATPLCDRTARRCAPCDGSYASGGQHPCGPSRPACNATGACVECVDESACASDGLACKNQQCVVCTADSDCASGRCHADGTCAPLSAVVYVAHAAACRNDVHASTPQDPYCEIAPSLAATGETIVQLAPSSQPYAGVTLSGAAAQDVSILGPGAELATIAGANADGVAVQGESGHLVTLYASRVTITSSGFSSDVGCYGKSDNAWVTLASTVLRGGVSYGLFAYGCHVAVERSVVRDNAYGITLSYSPYSISRSFVASNTSGGIHLSYSEGTMEALTVVGNHAESGAAGIACDTSCFAEYSIVVDNANTTTSGDEAQVDTNVSLATCVVGVGTTRGFACTPAFVSLDDPHLDMKSPDGAAQNAACVFGHGGASNPDIDGDPVGGDPALGADQPS